MRDVSRRILSVADARYFAERRVPKSVFQGIDRPQGVTARLNQKAFEEVLFRPVAGRPVPQHETSTTVLGHDVKLPVILSSVGTLKTLHRGGELAATRAAGDAGIIQFVSAATTTPIEEIVAAASAPVYQQIYYLGRREASVPIIERAKAAGVSGLVIVVDNAGRHAGPEPALYPERATLPSRVSIAQTLRFLPQVWNKPAWLWSFARAGMKLPAVHITSPPMSYHEFNRAAGGPRDVATFDDLPWIRAHWDGKIVVKGVIIADAARRALDCGADAIVVSNHGGNFLDSTLPTLRALPEIVDAVGDRTEVLIDGGIRRGHDVVKALALGAKAVLIGRAYLYGLMAAGEPGVRRVLGLFRQQIESTMACLGVTSTDELDASFLELPASWAGISLAELLRTKPQSR